MICIKLPSVARVAAGLAGRLAACFVSLLLALPQAQAQAQSAPQPRLPTIDLQAGIHIIKTELAITPEQQQVGMMFRREMGTNDGMLFISEESGQRCFWMRNTLVPLTIAFLADDGTIVNLADMDAQSDRSHCSSKPVRFALEVNRGWFAKRGLKAGAKIKGKPFGS